MFSLINTGQKEIYALVFVDEILASVTAIACAIVVAMVVVVVGLGEVIATGDVILGDMVDGLTLDSQKKL